MKKVNVEAKKDNMEIREFAGTASGLTKLLLNSKPVLHQNYNGKIVIEVRLQLIASSTKEYEITPCEYGGCLCVGKRYYQTGDFPIQLTEGAITVWNAFVDDCAEKLIEFVKNN